MFITIHTKEAYVAYGEIDPQLTSFSDEAWWQNNATGVHRIHI
jgi:hypothetical protein